MSIVIGLTGSFGSGCGEAAKYFEKKGFAVYSLTDIIREEINKKGINNPKRNDFQNIGDELRKKHGNDYLAKCVYKKIDSKKHNNILIKSIRNHYEVKFFEEKFQSNFYLINIDAPKDIRYERVKNEYTSLNDFERDDERDSGENQPEYGQHVKRCVDLAGIIINNLDDLNKFHKKLEEYTNIILRKGREKPTQLEINMSHAFRCSLNSTCLKRKVGAVIIGNGGILASGYNSTPFINNKEISIPSCSDLGYCYRDIYRKCLKDDCDAPVTFTFDSCLICKNPVIKEQKESLIKHLDLCRAIHAEERAILQIAKRGGVSFKNTCLYTTTFPCILCAKKIVEVGISEVVYIDPYPYSESKILMEKAGVNIKKFEGVKSKLIDILFS